MHVSPPNTHYNFQRTPKLASDAPITHNRFGNGSSNQCNSSCPVDYTYIGNTSSPPGKPVCAAPSYYRTNTGTYYNTQQECEDSASHGAKTNGCEYVINNYPNFGRGYLPKCDKGYYSRGDRAGKGPYAIDPFHCYKICPPNWTGELNYHYCISN